MRKWCQGVWCLHHGYGKTKLASEQTRDDIAFRYLDKMWLREDRNRWPFEPTGFMSELSQETQDCLDCFQQGIDKYLLQDWDGALSLFEKQKVDQISLLLHPA